MKKRTRIVAALCASALGGYVQHITLSGGASSTSAKGGSSAKILSVSSANEKPRGRITNVRSPVRDSQVQAINYQAPAAKPGAPSAPSLRPANPAPAPQPKLTPASPPPRVIAPEPTLGGPSLAPPAVPHDMVVEGAPITDRSQLASVPTSSAPMAPMASESPVGEMMTQALAPDRFYATADYLYWVTKGMDLPPLVTSSPVGTPQNQAGVLGQPGTALLFGNNEANDGWRSGMRFNFGYLIRDDRPTWIEAGFFGLGASSSGFTANSTGNPILARPFTDAVTGLQNSELVAFPNIVSGTVSVATTSNNFYGLGAALRRELCNQMDPCTGRGITLDGILGYRHLNMADGLAIRENLTVTNPAGLIAQGTTINVFDEFRTRNQFNGADLGLSTRWYRGQIFFDLLTKVALGNTHQEAIINGTTVVTPPGGATLTRNGGLLAQQTNIGRYSSEEFSFVPEIGLNVGVNVTKNILVSAGYNFIYWSNVLRAGDQIDPVINTTQIPPGVLVGPARPAFPNNDSDFWAHGFNARLELRF